MILLLDVNHAAKWSVAYPQHIGALTTDYGSGQIAPLASLLWGADNGCFTNRFEPFRFRTFLRRRAEFAETCRFVVAPDVVGNARATLSSFSSWADEIRNLGLPVALALQDGMTIESVPWDELGAVFVGGTTEYKMSRGVVAILERAAELGKWRHVGRVNSLRRISHFWGLADSFDGSGYNRFQNAMIPRTIQELTRRNMQRAIVY